MSHRIYADFNAYAGRGGDCALLLERAGTLRDLHRFQVRLEEGMTLTFWDQSDEYQDLEVDALLVYLSRRFKSEWVGEFSWDSLRYVPHKPAVDIMEAYPCFRCREELSPNLGTISFPEGAVCPTCGLSVGYPMEPPI